MKKITTVFAAILFASIALTSCGGNQSDKTSSEETTTTETTPTETTLTESQEDPASTELNTGSASDCDTFIKDYEEYADSYIVIVKKYKADPTDATILTEYTDLAQKAVKMQEGAANCTDPKYTKKLMEIASKIAKAAI
jgi:ABC-type glycerol-3-phosphate transport system substrate-binding protein